MNSFFFRAVKDWCPPALYRRLRPLQKLPPIETDVFRGPFPDWQIALTESAGYGSEVILQRVLDSTLKVIRGEAAYERDSVVFDRIQYSWPVATALLWASSAEGGRLNVLDFGGSLGSSFFENKEFLNTVPNISWGVVEQQHFVECGRAALNVSGLHFFHSIDEYTQTFSPNLVLLSSVLQYLPDYGSILEQLARLKPEFIVIDRTIVNIQSSDMIYVQRVPKVIYEASYPVYSISENSLLRRIVERGYSLVSDFQSLPFPSLEKINSRFKGYLFRRSSDE